MQVANCVWVQSPITVCQGFLSTSDSQKLNNNCWINLPGYDGGVSLFPLVVRFYPSVSADRRTFTAAKMSLKFCWELSFETDCSSPFGSIKICLTDWLSRFHCAGPLNFDIFNRRAHQVAVCHKVWESNVNLESFFFLKEEDEEEEKSEDLNRQLLYTERCSQSPGFCVLRSQIDFISFIYYFNCLIN